MKSNSTVGLCVKQVKPVSPKMDKSLGKIHDSLRPLNWILRIFALNRNVEEQPKAQVLFLSKMLLTMGLMGSLDSFCMYYKVSYIFQNISTSIKLTDCVQMIFDQIQYVVDLWFIYKFRGLVTLGYLKKYELMDRILGTTDCTIIKNKLANLVCIFTSLWVISSAFDFVAWYQVYGFMTPLIYSIAYLYLFIKMVTMLELTSHVLHIEIRLTIIADLIQHYYSVCPDNWTSMAEDSTSQNASSPSILNLKKRLHPLRVLSKNEHHEIQWLTKLYLLLTEQVEFIKCVFGFRIMLNSLSFLIDIIRLSNISVRLILGTQVVMHGSKYIPAVSSLVRMLICVAMLLSLVFHCEKTYDQNDKIVSIIDHILVNKDPNVQLRAAMAELRALVLARPISFIMAKFFRLDFQFLMSIASVTATYTIILLQSMN